ncbi:lactonase family protein [Marinobacter sp. V034]|uniref:lactonase family protein n=1 Tax=Marinobacter sp. V034 TaxID=3459610 RepID=UPI00404407BB
MNNKNRLSAIAASVAISLSLTGCNLWDGGSTSTPDPDPAPTTVKYTIGGDISGLASGQQVSMQNNGGDTLTLSANGGFTFAAPIEADGSYNVVVSEQPVGVQSCSVSSGSGSNVSANVTSVKVSCSSHNVYVSDAANPQIFQYAIEHDGTLTPLSSATVSTTGPTQGFAIHPSGTHLYATINSMNQVEQFNIANDGSLTAMTTPAVPTGAGPYQATVSPDGKYLFVGNQGGASITSFSIASDGSLTAVGTYSCSTQCNNVQGLAVDSSSSYLYIGGAQYRYIVTMTIATDGSLSNPVGVYGSSLGGRAVETDPSGAYLLAGGNSSISEFTIDSTDGSLSLYSTIPLTDSGTQTMVFDPSGSHLYLSMGISNTVNQFFYDNGTLTALSPASVSAGASQTNVYDVAVDPTGRYTYTLNRNSRDISQFVVGSDGALSANTVSGVVSLPNSPLPDPLSIIVR